MLHSHYYLTVLFAIITPCQLLKLAAKLEFHMKRVVADCIHLRYSFKKVCPFMVYVGHLAMFHDVQSV
jgi:hypothetical protein